MDGRNPAPPQTPWKDDSLVNSNKQWLVMVSKLCRISSIRSSNKNKHAHILSEHLGEIRQAGEGTHKHAVS